MILSWEFQLLGVLIVWDLLIMWFNSSFPALLTHLITKTPIPESWKDYITEDAFDYSTFTRSDWEVWINLTFPKLGELLTCPVCFSRHLAYVVGFLLWIIMPISFINMLGIFFWPGLAVTLHKKLSS